MDNILPIAYISFLLVLLGITVVVIFGQIIKSRNTEMALSRLQNKLKNEPGTAEEYYEIASIFLDKKLYTQAISLLQKALKSGDIEEQNLGLIYNGLGFAYFAQEQYDLAIRNYKEALKLQPDYVTALNNLGHAYERKKLTVQALEAYEEVLKSEPDNQTAKRRAESLRKRLAPSA